MQSGLGCVVDGAKNVGNNLVYQVSPGFFQTVVRDKITYSSDGSNLDNSPLGLDKQREKSLTHEDHREEIRLERLPRFRQLGLYRRYSII